MVPMTDSPPVGVHPPCRRDTATEAGVLVPERPAKDPGRPTRLAIGDVRRGPPAPAAEVGRAETSDVEAYTSRR